MDELYTFPTPPEPGHAPRCPPELIVITETPWLSGTRAVSYYGPVSSVGFERYRKRTPLTRIVTAYRSEIQRKASDLGANVVVGCEVHFDPFAQQGHAAGISWNVFGTAARLELL